MDSSSNWFVSLNDFQHLYKSQQVFFLTQCLLFFGGLCTLKHAWSNGGRLLLLWFTVIVNGTLLELISTSVPNMSIFWHSQGPVMLFGGKVPLGIIFFYPCVYYTSMVSASVLKLPRFYESIAAGIIAEVINLPVDYVGLKYVQFTWHDSDPNMLDRGDLVPWNALYFHLLYGTVQCFLFDINEGARKVMGDNGNRGETSKWRLFLRNIAASIPLLFISFAICHHLLHDFLGVHTQITFLLTLSSGIGLVWCASGAQPGGQQYKSGARTIGEIGQTYLRIFVFIYYLFFLLVPFLFHPERVVTSGPRQPIGPCNITEPVQTIFGQVLERHRYICRKKEDFNYFDFHCVPEFAPAENEIISDYTICGTPFKNRAEFVSIVICDAILAFCILRRIFAQNYSPSDSKKRKQL